MESIIGLSMDTNNSTPNITQNSSDNSGLMVHQVLATSYVVYFVAIFAGYLMSLFGDYKFLSPVFDTVGFLFIMLGTALSFWAQYVSGKSSKSRNAPKDSISHVNFLVGPYNYTRSPTQYGLLCMALGLAFVYGSMMMVATTLIAFVLGKFVFIPMEEKHLLNKYGSSYEEYKKKVKF